MRTSGRLVATSEKPLIRPWLKSMEGALPHSIPRTWLTCSSNPFQHRLVEVPVASPQEPLPPQVPWGSQPSDGSMDFNNGILAFPPTLIIPVSELDWFDEFEIQQLLGEDIAALFTADSQNQADDEAKDLPPPGKSPNAE
jgi:hypothetical protein